MKKLIMLLLIALPMVAFTQTRKTTQEMDGKGVNEPEPKAYYGEVLVIDQQGRQIVRVNFDGATTAALMDKTVLDEIEKLRKTSFENILQAINTVSLMGWKVGDSFTVETRQGKEIHILISKDQMKIDASKLSTGNAGGAEKTGGEKVAPAKTQKK
ncbi:MAG: hypothetical protein RL226_45 [Bacteroidota bacterium]|jgi:hypothetical protein